MINIENRKFLYAQLKEIEAISKRNEKLILENEFLSLSDVELIKYIFSYRDRQAVYLGRKKVYAYIELPDMDLEGQDLTGVEITRFVPGTIQDGRIAKSAINLKDTNVTINMSTIYHNEEIIHQDFYEYITDLSRCNFQGCNLYGRTQEEQKMYSMDSKSKYTFKGLKALDKRYVKRRELHRQTQNSKRKSDEIYSRLLSTLSIDITLGSKEQVDLTDYDFSELNKSECEKVLKLIGVRRVNVGYTRLDPNRMGAETPYTLAQSTKDALTIEDTQFLVKHLGAISQVHEQLENTRRQSRNFSIAFREVVNYMYRKDMYSVPEKYWRYLKEENLNELLYNLYRKRQFNKVLKYVNCLSKGNANLIVCESSQKQENEFLGALLQRLNEEILHTSTLIQVYSKKGLDMIPGKMYSNVLFSGILEREYKNKNMTVVSSILPRTTGKVPKKILRSEYENKRPKIVSENFEKAPEDIKKLLIRDEYEDGDLELVTRNIRYLSNTDQIDFLLEVFRNNAEDSKKILLSTKFKNRTRIINESIIRREIDFVSEMWDSLQGFEKDRVLELQNKRGNFSFLADLEAHMLQKNRDRKDNEMILVEEDKKKGDLLQAFESENGISFSASRVLPIEQREILLGIFRKSSNMGESRAETKEEKKQREKTVDEIIKRLHDKRLKETARIKTMYSEGGSLSATNRKDKAELENKSARVKYLVIDINGVVILEPLGQKNNATYITRKTDDVEQRLVNFGRKGALSNGFYKVAHNESESNRYNYESNHILKLLDMSLEDKESLFKILKGIKSNKKYCNLDTLEAKYKAIRLAKEYKLGKEDVVNAGQKQVFQEGDSKDAK